MTDLRGITERWKQVRCLFEAPILDDRKWSKIPGIPADAFILDLEDSVPPERKLEARQRVLEYLGSPEYFAGRMAIARVNHLETPWGRDDLVALAEAGVEQLMYPKVESPGDIEAVSAVCNEVGAHPALRVGIESARGIVSVEEIAAMPQVVCLGCGIGDLHVDLGQALYNSSGDLHPVHLYPKARTVMAAVAFGKAKLGFPQVPDIRDLDDYRRRAKFEKEMGFDGCSAYYPPHVDVLLEVFTPSAAEIDHAREIVEVYEATLAQGRPAVKLSNGRVLLVHEYKEALRTLNRLEEPRA